LILQDKAAANRVKTADEESFPVSLDESLAGSDLLWKQSYSETTDDERLLALLVRGRIHGPGIIRSVGTVELFDSLGNLVSNEADRFGSFEFHAVDQSELDNEDFEGENPEVEEMFTSPELNHPSITHLPMIIAGISLSLSQNEEFNLQVATLEMIVRLENNQLLAISFENKEYAGP